ncbi:MAG: hypothetical protein AB7O60_02030 [Variibacter sp.]
MTASLSPDLAFALALVMKMIFAACFVVAASLTAERSGVIVGAMVAALPVSTAPAYVLLAIDHGGAFIAASAVTSLVANALMTVYCAAYVLAAQRHGLLASVATAIGAWILAWLVLSCREWGFVDGIALNAVTSALVIPLVSRYQHAPIIPPKRRWYDVPLRAGLVAALVLAVMLVSGQAGPALTGLLAGLPVGFSCLILILHPRVGGRATAAVIAGAQLGVLGYTAALAAVHLTAIPFGATVALILAFVICVGWNLLLLFWRQGKFARAR